jgi:hypothetical protein
VLEMRLHQAQVESMAPIDLISCLVSDELTRRGDRLLERRRKQAQFRDPQKNIENFDFTFNPKGLGLRGPANLGMPGFAAFEPVITCMAGFALLSRLHLPGGHIWTSAAFR